MKPGSAPTPPNDEARDPLLDALRQHLGDYGEAPPPAAWAAIRRRVAPPPRPWWRRGRRMLPLLALLAGMLLVSVPAGHHGQERASFQSLAKFHSATNQNSKSKNSLSSSSSKSLAARRHLADSTSLSASSAALATSQSTVLSSESAASQKALRVAAAPARPSGKPAVAALPGAKKAATPRWAKDAAQAAEKWPGSTPPNRLPHRHTAGFALKLTTHGKPASAQRAIDQPNATSAAKTYGAYPGQHTARLAPLAQSTKAAARRRTASAAVSGSSPLHAAPASPTGLLARRHYVRPNRAMRQAKPDARQATLAVASSLLSTQTSSLTTRSLPAERRALPDTLAPNQLSLFLPLAASAPVLAARPDSTPPPPVARRWALLVLAGPTLSYRTLGPAPTLAAGHPDFARLERPALGLGAQVQVRRVLSGRWALAVGVGYHEYATRLALSLKDTASVHQRDTYRLLTVPVQLGYALGAPQGRFSKALLLGAEPGWYLGGRSTEGSGCGCEQQAYTSAASSPYRSLSVAFSLGLDLRYRLGGPASRWQWLVQPTGRYVATPFVRVDAVGFTRRQPFSLGLLTGFSWDVR